MYYLIYCQCYKPSIAKNIPRLIDTIKICKISKYAGHLVFQNCAKQNIYC